MKIECIPVLLTKTSLKVPPPSCIARRFPVLHVVVSSGNILPTPAEAEGKLQLWESW